MTLTPEQLALRRSGVGGSEIASLVGEHPSMTAFDVWASKRGYDSFEQTDAMDFGNHLEPAILSIYSDRVAPAVACGKETLRHPTVSIALATLDGRVVGEPRAVECKAVGRWTPVWEHAPAHYWIQCQWQMFVADLPSADIAALFCLDEFKTFRVERDDDMIALLVDAAERFWRDHVEANVPPPITGSRRNGAALAAMYPRGTAPMGPWPLPAPGSPSPFLTACDVASARAMATEAKKRADAAGNALRMMIGDAEGFEDDTHTATWRAGAKGKTRWEDVARELGATTALIAKHTSAPSRTLRLTGFGNEDDE